MQDDSGSPSARAAGRTSFNGNGAGPNKQRASPHGPASVRKDKDDEPAPFCQQTRHQTVVVANDAGAELLKVEKPEPWVVAEIVGCLKMKNSMLAHGACERVKKIARAYPVETAGSEIMEQLISILQHDAGGALAGGVLQALSIMALHPEGRQRVCLAGAVGPLISFIRAADLESPNLDRAVLLLMNLAPDGSNRRVIREEGGVEALVEVLRVAPLGELVLEHALGAVHNLVLLDPKAKQRAMEAGILPPLVRCLAAARGGLLESELCSVRGRMILTELLKLPDAEARLAAVAAEMGVKL